MNELLRIPGVTKETPADEHLKTASARMQYFPTNSGFDEATTQDGSIRPHWQKFFGSVAEMGKEEFAKRWRDAQHLIRDNGVTYNVYGDASGIARPWKLDPIPLLITPSEASHLEAGLVQRARLLELILSDIYGSQQLIRNGLIPSELIYANPAFLRPCHNVRPPGGHYLHLYAANLGRAKTGKWYVIGDRTQSPSGAGYALENRIVMTRALPETFRDCKVNRLALFFQTLRNTLRSISPRQKENPRIVLLTPGPYNETYFEHAYLARYLGYTLVQGSDLTVRDNQVYLKVLGGLQEVDVIFRRLDDDFCDPLELRSDSFLGVPGLMHAVRTGNVAVANALGTGVLETPALNRYLPKLCRELFGEDLRLETVPTWWCGDPEAAQYVIEHLDDLVVKPAFPNFHIEPVFPAELGSSQKAEWISRLRSRPRDFVAQSRLDLSTAPVFSNERLVDRKLVLRAYLAADRDSFIAMPGGLTRVSASENTMVVSMQRGGGSKDTWVMAAGAVSDFSLLASGGKVKLTRAGGDLPSRAADNLFWLGRYAERAEGTTRLLRGIFVRLADRNSLTESQEISALLSALSLLTETQISTTAPNDPEKQALEAIFSLSVSGSLANAVHSVLRVAGVTRDLISIDMWRVLNGLSDFPSDIESFGPDGPTTADVLDLLNRTIITLAAFGGLAVESMTRGAGWRFLDMGRKLERSVNLIALLKGCIVTPEAQEGPILDAVLDVADSGMTYRRRYLNVLQAEAVIDLLVFDETNPRSLATQFASLEDDVNHLPRPEGETGRSPEQRFVLAALSSVRLAEPENLAEVRDGTRVALGNLLDHVGNWLPILSDAITQHYLSHLQTTRHLATSAVPLRNTADSGDSL